MRITGERARGQLGRLFSAGLISGVAGLACTSELSGSLRLSIVDADGGGSAETEDGALGSSGDDAGASRTPSSGSGPVLQSSVPEAGESAVELDRDLVLTFDRPVVAGEGNFVLVDTLGLVPFAEVSAADVTIDLSSVTVDWGASLVPSTAYHVLVDEGALLDQEGEPFAGLSWMEGLAFNTSSPAIGVVATSPEQAATDVALDEDLRITFDTQVALSAAGSITLWNYEDDTQVLALSLGAPRVELDGESLTVDLQGELQYGQHYYVTLSPDSLVNDANVTFGGITGKSELHFKTLPPPRLTLASTSPAFGEAQVPVDRGFVFTFSQSVEAGTGELSIHAKEGELLQSVAAKSAPVVYSGEVVTVAIPAHLDFDTEYYVLIDEGFVKSVDGAAYAGVADPMAYTFTTAAGEVEQLTLSSVSPAAGDIGVAVDGVITLSFEQEVLVGSGTVSLLRQDGTEYDRVDVADEAAVVVAGTTATLNFAKELEGSTSYTLTLGLGSFTTAAQGRFDGLTAAAGHTFTTEAGFGIASRTPATGATGVNFTSDLVIEFSSAVRLGPGALEVRSVAGDMLLEAVPLSSSRVSVDGASVTIDLDNLLDGSSAYVITLPAGSVLEAEGNGEFAGIASGDWTFTTGEVAVPGDVGDSLVLWLDAELEPSLKQDGGVHLWADRSTSHNNLRQPDAARRPTRQATGINGLPATLFSGAEFLELLVPFELGAFEAFVVWQSGVAVGTSGKRNILTNGKHFQLIHSHPAGAAQSVSSCFSNCSGEGGDWYSARFATPPPVGQPVLWDVGFQFGTTTLFSRSQGGGAVYQTAPTTAPESPQQPFTLGGALETCASQGGCNFQGAVGEVLLYGRDLNQADRMAVNAYLQEKWGFASPSCGADEQPMRNGSCLFVQRSSWAFDQARSSCQGRGPGWDLVSIRSRQDQEDVNDAISDNASDVWIGATDPGGADIWRWAADTSRFWEGRWAGQAVGGSYTNWLAGEPTGGLGEECARLRFDGGVWTWGDFACYQSLRSLCQGPR